MGQKVLLFYIYAMTILTFSILRCGQICRAAPEKKGAGKGFISAVCFGWQRRNVSGDVHLPSQDQALVFCGRHPTHHPGSGGNFILLFGISFLQQEGGICTDAALLLCFYFNSKYNRARSVSRSSARDNVRETVDLFTHICLAISVRVSPSKKCIITTCFCRWVNCVLMARYKNRRYSSRCRWLLPPRKQLSRSG